MIQQGKKIPKEVKDVVISAFGSVAGLTEYGEKIGVKKSYCTKLIYGFEPLPNKKETVKNILKVLQEAHRLHAEKSKQTHDLIGKSIDQVQKIIKNVPARR